MSSLSPDGPADYDPDRVASLACQADPGLPEQDALRLAREAWQHLREVGGGDAPEIARRLMAGPSTTGATPANVVAKAAVDFCAEHEIDPQA